jgi:PAS domain S-box-containing protein
LSLALRNISIQAERIRTKYLLRERIKELTTIHQVNKVLQNETLKVDEVLKAIVNLLPSGWQYPEICVARIDFDGLVCTSPDFQVTPYCQSADFKLVDGRSGQIQIVYIQERPQEFEGPFLKEERDLINTIAENIRLYFDKIAQQAAVAESESYFRSSFEHAAIGKVLTDLKGNFFRVNKAFCNLLGYSRSELQKLSFQQITHPDDLNESSDTVDMIIRGQVDYLRLEKRYIHSSGSVIWVNLNTAIVRDVNNNPLYFVSQMENITDRKLADVALAKSEANMKTIFNNTDVAYLLLDSHYNVIAFNLRFKNSFETEAEAEVQLNSYLFDVVPKDRRERMKGTFDSVMTTLQPVEYEYEYNIKNKRGYFHVSIIPVISGTEAIGVCLSATDITNRKKLELERQAIIDDLMQRNRDLQQFAHIVSHNVRGPLSTILGLVDLLQYDLSPEDVKLYISSIKITADKLDDVVRDLNKILQVRRELSEPKTTVKFNAIVSEITSGIAQLISDSNTTITTDFTQVDELLTVRSYLYAIFYNLITNSIKFCKPDVPPFIKIWTELHDGKIIICFRDNGIGIDMAHNREKIFMLYQRFNFDVEGKGLGLFMCKTQIEVLNGKIEVESQPGEGATFRLIFPVTN